MFLNRMLCIQALLIIFYRNGFIVKMHMFIFKKQGTLDQILDTFKEV